MKVYAGADPVTGKERLLRETCPDCPSVLEAMGRLLKQVEGHKAPERDATLGRVLDLYLEVTELAATTRVTHETYIRRIIRPVLGDVKARKIGPDSLDALNVHLKCCSRICGRLGRTEHYADGPHGCDDRCGPLKDHRTTRPHKCDHRCRPHRRTPLAPSSRLKVLSIVSAAFSLAKRYKWIDANPAELATMPSPGDHEPDPPTSEQVAALLNLAFAEDEEFGLFCWTAFTTGGRRGELLGLRENRIDFDALDYGPEHPDTLAAHADLAYWTGETGDAAGARDQLTVFLPLEQRVLGPRHSETLNTRNQLARRAGEAGDAAGARDQLTVLLPIAEQFLGSEHRITLAIRHNLATWAAHAGDAAGPATSSPPCCPSASVLMVPSILTH